MATVKTSTDQIVQYLQTPEGRAKSDKEIAEQYGVHPGTVCRARKKALGGNGGSKAVLPLDELTISEKLQLRAIEGGLDKEAMDDYTAKYKAGVDLPALLVVLAGKVKYLVGGFHRYHSARRAGLTELPVEVVEGTWQDALCLAAKSNASNGLRFTKADRRKAVEAILAEFPDMLSMGSREFERRTGIDESTFRKVRNEIKDRKAADPVPMPDPTEGEGEAEIEADDETDEGDDDKAPSTRIEVSDGEAGPELVFHRQRHASLRNISQEDLDSLMQAPVFLTLAGDQLGVFVSEYFYRREMAEALEMLRAAHKANKPKGKVLPVLASFIEGIANIRMFKDFNICGNCGGKGCDGCRKRGYC